MHARSSAQVLLLRQALLQETDAVLRARLSAHVFAAALPSAHESRGDRAGNSAAGALRDDVRAAPGDRFTVSPRLFTQSLRVQKIR